MFMITTKPKQRQRHNSGDMTDDTWTGQGIVIRASSSFVTTVCCVNHTLQHLAVLTTQGGQYACVLT